MMDLNLICSFYLGLWPLLWCLNFFMQKTIFWIICLLSAIPLVQAAPSESSFPDVKFEISAKTIKTIFHSDISLATILVLVFTMIENSDFINLNAHRQSSIHANEGLAKVSPWLTTLARILKVELGSDRFNTLFTPTEQTSQLNELSELKLISKKLDHLIKALNLYSKFSHSVVAGMYQFHASAFTQYWNTCYGVIQTNKDITTRRHIWQAFIQESIRTVAAVSNINLRMNDGLTIKEVTKEAFRILGETGFIRAADDHACSECVQPFKQTADIITGDDPAAVAGVDAGGNNLPAFEGEAGHAAEIAADIEAARVEAAQRDNDAVANPDDDNDENTVSMIVIDGVVMGHTCCAMENCTEALANARGGVFCEPHNIEYGNKCRIADCLNIKVPGTQACNLQLHKGQWERFAKQHQRQNIPGS